MDTPIEGVVYENDLCVVELDVKSSWDDEGECWGAVFWWWFQNILI